ncbi:hypothetical protein [Flavobacterium sp. J27]|uniref:hypothetical protein n=1 Tax=Flavobacterium sp. J27 TaxID=2060419 RepID=UPI0010307E5F|nr:hypothetical protein [Flavobacterium sp. J27]
MNSIELQNKYYDSIVKHYSLHCENNGNYDSFKYLINNEFCFQKIDNLIINNQLVTWCYHDCISEYWNTEFIIDLLLKVNIEDLALNKSNSEDIEKNSSEYYYFENYNDFLIAKDKFLITFNNH